MALRELTKEQEAVVETAALETGGCKVEFGWQGADGPMVRLTKKDGFVGYCTEAGRILSPGWVSVFNHGYEEA